MYEKMNTMGFKMQKVIASDKRLSRSLKVTLKGAVNE